MQEIDEHLWRVEERLEQLLAGGRRNAAAGADALAAGADSLEAIGLTALAADVRAAARADGALPMLAAATRSLAACRLLRARIPADAPPPGDWAPLAPPPPTGKRAPAQDELIPIGRMLVGGEELWASVVQRGNAASRLVLLEPSPYAPLAQRPKSELEAMAEQSASMIGALGQRLFGRKVPLPPPGGDLVHSGDTPPWLGCRALGRLHWRGRYPLGPAGDIERCTLIEPTWLALSGSADTTALHQRGLWGLAANIDGVPVLVDMALQVKRLRTVERRDYVWLDPSVEAAFAAQGQGEYLSVSWVQGPLVVPLVLLDPSGGASPPRLTHLLPGSPSDLLYLAG